MEPLTVIILSTVLSVSTIGTILGLIVSTLEGLKGNKAYAGIISKYKDAIEQNKDGIKTLYDEIKQYDKKKIITLDEAESIIQHYNSIIELLVDGKNTLQQLASELNEYSESSTRGDKASAEIEKIITAIGKFNGRVQEFNEEAKNDKAMLEEKLGTTLPEIKIGFGGRRRKHHRKTRKHRSRKHKKTRKH